MPDDPNVLRRRTASILSPLRYPGAKRRLASYIARTIELNGLEPELFVELFAGGASVSLQLLASGAVERIGLVEIDPLVAGFWKTVFADADWLCERIETIDINLKMWRYYKTRPLKSARQRALACLFLNRTSFSGILAENAGPLGGWEQKSNYPLDCRFPRETIVKRIRQAAALADRVDFVWNMSWARALTLVGRVRRLRKLRLLYYCDPPFFEKADRLYRHHFSEKDHRQLRDRLIALREPWILSYDSTARVEELYGDVASKPTQLEILYSTSRNGGINIAREVLLSNLEHLPHERRLWQRSSEWRETKSRSFQQGTLNTTHRRGPRKIAGGAA